jgi:hypothetical protein
VTRNRKTGAAPASGGAFPPSAANLLDPGRSHSGPCVLGLSQLVEAAKAGRRSRSHTPGQPPTGPALSASGLLAGVDGPVSH